MKKTLLVVLTAFIMLFMPVSPASASTLGFTWSHSPHSWAYISVVDHTGNLWNVTGAVSAWGSGLHYRSTCATYRCVHVYESYLGRNNRIGISTWTYAKVPGGLRYTSFKIVMNNSYAYQGAATRDIAIKHELGHALGLGHDPYHDVMYPSTYYNYISLYERRELYNLYIR